MARPSNDSHRPRGSVATAAPPAVVAQTDSSTIHPASRTQVLVFAVAFLATIYPPLLSLHGQGIAGVFSFFPGDAFYYLSIAEHSVGKSFYTFDGSFPTNGFHPLWGSTSAPPLNSSDGRAIRSANSSSRSARVRVSSRRGRRFLR